MMKVAAFLLGVAAGIVLMLGIEIAANHVFAEPESTS